MKYLWSKYDDDCYYYLCYALTNIYTAKHRHTTAFLDERFGKIESFTWCKTNWHFSWINLQFKSSGRSVNILFVQISSAVQLLWLSCDGLSCVKCLEYCVSRAPTWFFSSGVKETLSSLKLLHLAYSIIRHYHRSLVIHQDPNSHVTFHEDSIHIGESKYWTWIVDLPLILLLVIFYYH